MAANNINILGEESFTKASENLPAYILGENDIKLEEIKIELDEACVDFTPIGQQFDLYPVDKVEEENLTAIIQLRLDPALCTCLMTTKKSNVVTRSMSKKHKDCKTPFYQ